jgi:hypothetical protein
MRLPAIALLLLPLAAAAQQKAPPPPSPNDPAETLTPQQQSAQDMLMIYEEFCLQRFPDPDAIQAGVAAHHLAPATPAETATALLGRTGKAWAAATPNGRYLIAFEARPHRGCAVTGSASDDEGIRAAFDLAVQSFASGHEFGMLQRPPLQTGKLAGRDTTLQLIGATPPGRTRQAFVNALSTNPDGSPQLRLTRELAPE